MVKPAGVADIHQDGCDLKKHGDLGQEAMHVPSKGSAAPEGRRDQGTQVAWLAARRCPARFAVLVLREAISEGQSVAGEACSHILPSQSASEVVS